MVVLTGVLTLTILVVLLGLAYAAYSVLFGPDSNDLFGLAALWSYAISQSLLSAIVMSVCYCYLRSAEDRDNNPPALNASD